MNETSHLSYEWMFLYMSVCSGASCRVNARYSMTTNTGLSPICSHNAGVGSLTDSHLQLIGLLIVQWECWHLTLPTMTLYSFSAHWGPCLSKLDQRDQRVDTMIQCSGKFELHMCSFYISRTIHPSISWTAFPVKGCQGAGANLFCHWVKDRVHSPSHENFRSKLLR